jgi:hypothetical protein
MVYSQGRVLIKFAERSGAVGKLVKAVCLSEAVGIGINPLSFGEKEKIGCTVK